MYVLRLVLCICCCCRPNISTALLVGSAPEPERVVLGTNACPGVKQTRWVYRQETEEGCGYMLIWACKFPAQTKKNDSVASGMGTWNSESLKEEVTHQLNCTPSVQLDRSRKYKKSPNLIKRRATYAYEAIYFLLAIDREMRATSNSAFLNL